ncbi:unnamed protein product [Rotaria sordida]|uniref:Uncharacterized protein n=1 Tax=Rotaria sordida TaxID=392033 RepID=A0A814DR89_9BILA|nr:unnamed protein product [Rotaria sordida]
MSDVYYGQQSVMEIINDCEDGSDELSTCLQQQYTSTQFQCRNQNCTLISYVCDGIHDCGDNIDENPNQYLSKVFDRVPLTYTTYKIRMFYMASMENRLTSEKCIS